MEGLIRLELAVNLARLLRAAFQLYVEALNTRGTRVGANVSLDVHARGGERANGR